MELVETLAPYAPREPCRQLIEILTKLAHANKSDTCIVSGEKIKELLYSWYGMTRSIRWVWYHLRAARREHLIIKQTRYRAINKRIVLKRRNRYRLGWRLMQRQANAAKSALKLMAMVEQGPRRQTVQKIAFGLQSLIKTVLPVPVLDG